MADFTKLVRSLTSATHKKPTHLKKSVGRPFWIGMAVSFGIAFCYFYPLARTVNGWMFGTIAVLAALLGGVLIQAGFDLREGIKSGEVRKRYLVALGCILVLAVIFGAIYYQTPEGGIERVVSVASLVIISALFGYIVGRAKG